MTTRGMDISTYDPFEQSTPYLKALSWLCRIGPMDVISAQNMDSVLEDEVEKKVQQAIEIELHLVETW